MAKPGPGKPRSKTVWIAIGPPLRVRPPTVRLSRARGDQVTWKTRSKERFEVRFDKNGSPFGRKRFAGRSVFSGAPRRAARRSTRGYQYSVVAAGRRLDPRIIIDD